MAKYLPHGTTFSFDGNLVGGLISVSTPDRTRGEGETTDSDSGGTREFIAGLRDPGSVELTFRHDPDDTGQQALETNFAAAAGTEVKACVITLPAAATAASGSQTYSFNGYVSAPPAGDLPLADDAAAEQTATIRVTGTVTIA